MRATAKQPLTSTKLNLTSSSVPLNYHAPLRIRKHVSNNVRKALNEDFHDEKETGRSRPLSLKTRTKSTSEIPRLTSESLVDEENVDQEEVHSLQNSLNRTRRVSQDSVISSDPVTQWLDQSQQFQKFPKSQSSTDSNVQSPNERLETISPLPSHANDNGGSSSQPTKSLQITTKRPQFDTGKPSVAILSPLQESGSSSYKPQAVMGATWHTADCTSISSSEWDDDICEFDRQESLRVRAMLETIERTLFDGNLSGSSHSGNRSGKTKLRHSKSNGTTSEPSIESISMAPHLLKECLEWTSQFPHFRVLGSSLLPSLQSSSSSGYSGPMSINSGNGVAQYLYDTTKISNQSARSATPTGSSQILTIMKEETPKRLSQLSNESASPETISNTPRGTDSVVDSSPRCYSDAENLSVEGTAVLWHKVNNITPTVDEETFDIPIPYEEIFVADGVLEEPIATDGDDEMLENKMTFGRRRQGFPPLTPNAALRDNILNVLFDGVWRHVCTWLKPTLSVSIQRLNRDGLTSDTVLASQHAATGMSMGLEDLQSGGRRRYHAPLPADRASISTVPREDSFARTIRGGVTLHNTNLERLNPNEVNLANLLQITSKTLQQRALQQGAYQMNGRGDFVPDPSCLSTNVLDPNLQDLSKSITKSYQLNDSQMTKVSHVMNSSVANSPSTFHQSGLQLFLGGGRHNSTLSYTSSITNPPNLLSNPVSSRLPAARLAPLHDHCATPEQMQMSLAVNISESSLGNGLGHIIRGRALRQPHNSSLPLSLSLPQQSTSASRLSMSNTFTSDMLPPLPEQLQRSGTLPPIIGASRTNVSGSGTGLAGSTTISGRPSTTQTFRSDTPLGRRNLTPQHITHANHLLGIHGHGINNNPQNVSGPSLANSHGVVPSSHHYHNHHSFHHNHSSYLHHHQQKSLIYTHLWEEENSGNSETSSVSDIQTRDKSNRPVHPQHTLTQASPQAHSLNQQITTRSHPRALQGASQINSHNFSQQTKNAPAVSLYGSSALPSNSSSSNNNNNNNNNLPYRRMKTMNSVK